MTATGAEQRDITAEARERSSSPTQPLTPGPQPGQATGSTNPFEFGLAGTFESTGSSTRETSSNIPSPFAANFGALGSGAIGAGGGGSGTQSPTALQGRSSYTFPSGAHPSWMNVQGTPSVSVGQPTSMPYVFVMVPPGAPFVPAPFPGPPPPAGAPSIPAPVPVGGAGPTLAAGAFAASEHSSAMSTPQKRMTPVPQEEIDEGPKQLIVNFLDPEVTNADLHAAFSAIGPLDAARVIYDKETNESKGFGFVYFHRSADARTAIQCMTGHPLRGRRIKVSYANPQRPVKRTTLPDRSG